MKSREHLALSGTPVIGFGQEDPTPPATSGSSPWGMVVATSVVSAAAGWVIEEVARKFRGRR